MPILACLVIAWIIRHTITPREFVVMVLQQHFGLDLETATLIMLKIHHEGRGVCGVYPFDIAETRVATTSATVRTEVSKPRV